MGFGFFVNGIGLHKVWKAEEFIAIYTWGNANFEQTKCFEVVSRQQVIRCTNATGYIRSYVTSNIHEIQELFLLSVI